MVELSYINPLSSEGKKIVQEYGDLDKLIHENDELVGKIMHTHNQKMSNEKLIPKSIKDLAIKRMLWAIEKKHNKNYTQREFQYFFNTEIHKEDVITFHILAQAIAFNFNLTSRETRLFIESQGILIQERLAKMSLGIREKIVDDILTDIRVDGAIHWKDLKDIFSTKKISLRDLYISNGELILDRDEFLYLYEDEFTTRDPETMYDILVGETVKEQILSSLIMQKTEEYLKKIKEMSRIIEIHPIITQIGEELKEFIPQEISKYSAFYGGSGGIYGSVKGGKLIPEAFPPCIANVVQGVSSGGRNDAIVLLLTSFASYARLYPRIFSSEEQIKVSDMDPDLTITQNEILPLIFEAADNCTPPLFNDQPQEKINIISKLGFGMHSEVDIEHEGETKWYTPMSCEKIKIHLPQLCKPDGSCKGLNNPLSCYGRKKFQIDRKAKQDESKE
ncbi:MAG: DNA primase [archaeon]|nr:DNA primase [archaeon]